MPKARLPHQAPRHRQEVPAANAQKARAQMRLLIAHETGKDPFDPTVIREAKRRVTRQKPKDPLRIVVATLQTIHGEGRFGRKKIFIASLWDRVGAIIGMTLLEFKHWLIKQHVQQSLELARADLISAMPYDLVMRSETKTEGTHAGATFHFVLDPLV